MFLWGKAIIIMQPNLRNFELNIHYRCIFVRAPAKFCFVQLTTGDVKEIHRVHVF